MSTRWLALEYIGKGICLAFLALLALVEPDWWRTGVFFTAALLGLAGALARAAYQAIQAGHRIRGRAPAFLLYLLLDNPSLVYGGVLAGVLLGTGLQIWLFAAWQVSQVLLALAAGVLLGAVFLLLRQVHNRWMRTGTVLLVATGVAVGTAYLLENHTTLLDGSQRLLFGGHVLLAIPLLYLLILAGRAEETELEIGAMCVALGLALWMLLPEAARLLAVLLPIAIYLVYTQQVLRRLRIFKHVLRGMSYNNLGLHREALLAYRRALQLDPNNALAREGHWRVHKDMDFTKVVHEPATMALVDLNLCLDRAKELLLRTGPVSDKLDEAHKLLTLVLDQRPITQPAVYYWRAVAHTHAKEFDKAEAELRTVLDDASYPPADPYRQSVLLASWQLALLQHPELKRRLGMPLLTTEGRRLDAIAVAEHQLAETPDDAGAGELKRFLYDGLTEPEYRIRAGADRHVPSQELDHDYCLQLGLALLGDAGRWQRAQYLRIAAQGLPMRGPSIYFQIAQAGQQAGDDEAARYNFEMVKLLAREVGVKKLDADNQQAYFTTVKQLGEAAYARGEWGKAIENLILYVESEQSGLDTMRLLTELHERKGDVLGALFFNEKVLLFDPKNKHALERKESYYYSVSPADSQARLEQVHKTFDVGYCLRKAKSLLDLKSSGPEQIDWALHLVKLARVAQPDHIQALTLGAVARLRRGEQNEAVPLLEQARNAKPERFASSEEEEAWYTANRLLGNLYLDTLSRPDLAVQCLNDYRKYSKSGADTLYKMGQAYEQLGDRAKAAKCYQNVTIYDHRLRYEAELALRRLETST